MDSIATKGLPKYIGKKQQIGIGTVRAINTIVLIDAAVELRLKLELNNTPAADTSKELLTSNKMRGIITKGFKAPNKINTKIWAKRMAQYIQDLQHEPIIFPIAIFFPLKGLVRRIGHVRASFSEVIHVEAYVEVRIKAIK